MSRLDTLQPKQQLFCLLKEAKRRRDSRKILQLFPDDGPLSRHNYPKHMAFIAASLKYLEICIIAANRVGKSLLGGFVLACHLSGWYPAWWAGRRFDRPVNAWAAGDTSQTVRDIAQFILLGPPGAWGTGLIPGDSIVKINRKAGNTPNVVESVEVKHKSGLGNSILTFKTYEQGRKSFQGTDMDVIWLDEECPENVYEECLLRTMETKQRDQGGLMMLTFTPLMGLTPVVLKFMPGGKLPTEQSTSSRFVVNADWDDAPHLSDDEKARMIANMHPHLRKARSKGIPHLGAGAIYPVEEEEIICEPFEIPPWWLHVYALDVGWNRTACLWGAIDPNALVVYLYSEHYQGQAEPVIHVEAIKARGEWIPGVIDPTARNRNSKDGSKLFDDYQNLGLVLSPAINTVFSGINDVWGLLSSGKLKVFKTLRNWLGEFRIYRRDENGQIVKENDHLMDCTRYLVVSGIGCARTKPYDEDELMLRRLNSPDNGRSDVGGY